MSPQHIGSALAPTALTAFALLAAIATAGCGTRSDLSAAGVGADATFDGPDGVPDAGDAADDQGTLDARSCAAPHADAGYHMCCAAEFCAGYCVDGGRCVCFEVPGGCPAPLVCCNNGCRDVRTCEM